MPDMSVKGAHLESLLDHFQFQHEDNFRKSRDHALRADVYLDVVHRLKRALEEDARKSETEAKQ